MSLCACRWICATGSWTLSPAQVPSPIPAQPALEPWSWSLLPSAGCQENPSLRSYTYNCFFVVVIIVAIWIVTLPSYTWNKGLKLVWATRGVKAFLLLLLQTNARKALDVLWERRQKGSDLVGTVINIHNEEWVRRGKRPSKGAGSSRWRLM